MSGITIKIDVGSTQEKSSARATGSLKHIVTDEERATFGIRDADLKRKVGAYMGREPNDVYVRSPTPWENLYQRQGWQQVQTVLEPIETKILSVETVPTILSKMEFRNESNKKGTFSGKLSKQVSNTVGTSWTKSKTLSFNQDVRYNIGFLGTGAGGSTSLKFAARWGKNGTESQTTTIGTEAGVSRDLEPGEVVEAALSANSGRMTVRITYEAHLTGQTAVVLLNAPKFDVLHFCRISISAVLGASNSVTITEDIEIGYYDEVCVTIKNLAGERNTEV